MKGTKDRVLYLLKICKDKFNIDGLTPGEISYTLTEIFRIPTSKETISMTLMNNLGVHRIKNKSSYLYKLMKPGEDYLKSLQISKK